MDKVRIFDPNLGKSGEYVDHWQCSSCEKAYKSPDFIWCCTTCKQNVCDACKNEIHENHNTLKSEYTICQAHDSDCSCSACNPDLYGFYYPTVDKMETNLTMSDDLILLGEGDYNPDMLMAQIPVLSSDFEYDTPNLFFGDFAKRSDGPLSYSVDLDRTIIPVYKHQADAFDLGKKIAELYMDKSKWKINNEWNNF